MQGEARAVVGEPMRIGCLPALTHVSNASSDFATYRANGVTRGSLRRHTFPGGIFWIIINAPKGIHSYTFWMAFEVPPSFVLSTRLLQAEVFFFISCLLRCSASQKKAQFSIVLSSLKREQHIAWLALFWIALAC